eukprot:Gb_19359 [translate_table: standard]
MEQCTLWNAKVGKRKNKASEITVSIDQDCMLSSGLRVCKGPNVDTSKTSCPVANTENFIHTLALVFTLYLSCQLLHFKGVPFFHAGDDMLRSKSLDRDSYNSGDWFNRLDFTYESNNWGVGLPPKAKNGSHWPLMKTLLANQSLKPGKHHILSAVENLQNLLRIRRSSPLFRLRTADAIQARVRFHNTGPSWVPGAVVMSIEDGDEGFPGLAQIDQVYRRIVVIFNARPSKLIVQISALKALPLSLHQIQAKSSDTRVKSSSYNASTGAFDIPPRTTSVFVELR